MIAVGILVGALGAWMIALPHGTGPAVISAHARNGPSGLLIRLNFGDDSLGLRQHRADYLVDGTVIRWVDGTACVDLRPCGALERNVLTASGLTALRALLDANADLLSEPGAFKPHFAPDTQPARKDVTAVFVQERPDGDRFTVSVSSITSYDAPKWAPDPAITRLNDLAAMMADPETLGPGSLTNPNWAPYEPVATAVMLRLTPSIQPPVFDGPFGLDIKEAGWPFGGAPDGFGATFAPSPLMRIYSTPEDATFRCAFLSSDETLTAITSLPWESGVTLAKETLTAGRLWGSGSLRWGDSVNFDVRAVWLMPEDVGDSCADAFSY